MCPTIMEVEEKKPKTLDKSVLDLFYKLANENSQNRIDACLGILRSLSNKQAQENDKDDLHKDLKYCIERLIKGLASPRGAARLGFALLLTEILKKFTIIEIEDVLELVKQHLSFTPKQEKRDIVFGLVFAYSSLVRSGRLANHSHLSFIFLNIFDLWQGRNYIVNTCYEIIKELFDQLPSDTFKEKIWPHLKEKFIGGWDKCTPDTLWILLLCRRMFPEIANEKYLKKKFNTRDILSADNFENVKTFIRQTTSCLPKLHPLCSEILISCQNHKSLKEVWVALVDDNLFEGDQTEKSFVGFEMVKFILQNMQKKKIVKAALSPKFRAVFARSYVNMKSPINSASTQLAVYLSNFAKDSEDTDVQMLILKFFLQPPGNISLDQLLKKKEISLLVQNLLPDAVKIYCEFLKAIALKKNTDKDDDDVNITDNQRVIAVTQIGNLVSHAKIMTDIDWRINVIKFLFLHSFFAIKEVTTDILHCDQDIGEIPAKLRESFVNAFFKTLTSLYQRVDQQTSPIQHSLHCLLLLVDYTDQLLSDSVHLNPLFPLEQVQEPWLKIKRTIHKLQKQSKKDGKTNESNAFLALFLELGFHVFQDSSIADVLEELHICCKKALSNRKHSSEQPEDENEPPWVGVVTDIMLSLLSKSSHHLRRLVTSVFHLLCPFITQEALQQILVVIHPLKSNEDPMLVDESDEENLNFESGSSSDESDYNDPENYKVDEKFKLKVKEALGSAADVSDAESVVLSDSEMFKLDDALSLAFRERAKTGHTKMRSEDKAMLDFRLRCLDLVATYLKSEPPLQLVLQCIEPLLAAYEFSHRSEQQNHLLFKIVTTIETMTRVKKFQHYENVGKSDLKRILEMLIEKCHKEVNANVANKLYSLCVFVVSCFRRLESQKSPEKKSSKTPSYLKLYLSALENFVKGSNLFPQFFVSLMQSYPDTAWNIMEKFKEYAFCSSIRMYKQTQCLGLLSEAVKYAKAQTPIKTFEWVAFCQNFVPAVAGSLKLSLTQSAIKPVYFTELLEVLSACHSISEETTKTLILRDHSDLLPLLEQLSTQSQKRLSKKSRRLLRTVTQKLGGKIDSKKDKKMPITPSQSAQSSTETTNSIEKSDVSSKKRKSTSLEKKKKKFKTGDISEN
ncbi:myb-binding protein 1A isoform X1 [Parasteatoda tepidariorum]|uniref:myb-binding protein 1A isoform X1 n=1 Tax=Parasteatoda tepidariorum TaxID=114398 RepID=UPI0039BC3AED